MSAITVVSGEDEWEGVYLDGDLLEEGHCHVAGHAIEALAARLGIRLERVTVRQRWLDERGSLLARLGDIPAQQRRKA